MTYIFDIKNKIMYDLKLYPHNKILKEMKYHVKG